MTSLPPPTPLPDRKPLRDFLGGTDPYEAMIRAARTALQAAIAALLAVPVLDVSAFQAAGFAALTALLTFLHGLLGTTDRSAG